MRRAIRAALLRADVVHRGDGRRPVVALTFDDGPDEWTPPLLETLAAEGARATFFMLGSQVVRAPQVAAQVAAAGHDVGCHSDEHVDLALLPSAEVRSRLERAKRDVEDATGAGVTLFRPPYAVPDRRVARIARRAGLTPTVLRDVDPADWRARSADAVVRAVLAAVRPGSIVCLHDGVPPGNTGVPTRDATVAAVARLVPALRERGLEPVTVTELLR